MSRIVNSKRIAAMMVAAMVLFTVQMSIAQVKSIDGDRVLDPNRLLDIPIEMLPQERSELSQGEEPPEPDEKTGAGSTREFHGHDRSTASLQTVGCADSWTD